MPVATRSATLGALTLGGVPFGAVITDETGEKRHFTLRKHIDIVSDRTPQCARAFVGRLYRRDGSPMHYALYDPFFVEGAPRA